jgi:hypothetical protein
VAKKHRAHDEEAWRNARKICRLNARQLEMARRLGMNPRKLPRLRPGPKEHWKLPVAEFIEELYRKRFDLDPLEPRPRPADPGSHAPPPPSGDADRQSRPADAMSQVDSLACYFTNLADDLAKWRAHGSVDLDVMQQLSSELREIAAAIDTGTLVPEVPEIPVPPRRSGPAKSPRKGPEWTRGDRFSHDDIPF